MREISKGTEPSSLTKHRASLHSDYENYKDKDVLRVALVAEQRGLCCYCMGRIAANGDEMKIEHWHCVSRYPEEQLDYRNLLAACRGGEGEAPPIQHCDTKKADRDLQWNPADPMRRIEDQVEYGADGTIKSKDAAFYKELNDVLNLNVSHIKNARKATQSAIVDWGRLRGRSRPISRRRLEAKIQELSDATIMVAYGPVAIWWLRKLLARTVQ